MQYSDILLNQLKKGVFLTSGNQPCNVMTIGWGGLMIMWGKEVVVAPVRTSRYTKEFMDKTGTFALSVPKEGEYKKELSLCGTISGRTCDKMAQLPNKSAKAIDTLVVDNCLEYYECKTLAVVPLNADVIDASIAKFYADNDYHHIYIGEIVAKY